MWLPYGCVQAIYSEGALFLCDDNDVSIAPPKSRSGGSIVVTLEPLPKADYCSARTMQAWL